MANAPFEIIAGPARVYIAPVGTAFPKINQAPGAAWKDLGYTEGGINVQHNQSVELLRVDQLTGPVKAVRSEEELHVTFSLAQITLENYSHALNELTVTDVAPTATEAGYKWVPLYKGPDVKAVALLIRGPSPYGDGFNLQFEVPVAVQVGEPQISFVRGDKSVLEVDFVALEDATAPSEELKFGRLVAQDADPTP